MLSFFIDLFFEIVTPQFIVMVYTWFLASVGLFLIGKFLYELGWVIWRSTIRPLAQPSTHTYLKYGKPGSCRSWALVTGGSDGVGLAFCSNLAR